LKIRSNGEKTVFSAGTTGLAALIQVALFITREASSDFVGRFCFPVHLRKQAFASSGKAKPAAIAAGFSFVGTNG